ncbi:MAG TPA: type VI secretion system ImpA family N-terminal domain-containing protein [Burkholderiaceae bacterium]
MHETKSNACWDGSLNKQTGNSNDMGTTAVNAAAIRSENWPGHLKDSEIAERFAVLDQMINRHDAEGFGPLRKGEESFRWSVVESEARALLALQADLRVAIWLLRALIIQRGLPGLCEGLQLLLLTVRVSTDVLQPKSDPGEHPREAHVIALGWLGSEGLLALLRMSSVHPGLQTSLQDLTRSSALLEALTVEQRETALQWLAQACASLQAIREEISGSGGLWDRDPSVAIEFITGIALVLSPSKKKLPEVPDMESAAGSPAALSSMAIDLASVSVESRKDIELLLDKLLDYYLKFEPTHPAPVFIKRLRRMIGVSFEDALKELYSEAPSLLARLQSPA